MSAETSTLATRCTRAAPPEMAGDGWEWRDGAHVKTTAFAEHKRSGWSICVSDKTALPLGGYDVWSPWARPEVRQPAARARGKDLARALAYLYGELRREMVARGMVEESPDEIDLRNTIAIGRKILTRNNDTKHVHGRDHVAVLNTMGAPSLWVCRVVHREPVDRDCLAMQKRRAIP